MKIALVDDEQKCLDEMVGLVSSFGTQHRCQVETVPFLSGEAFLEAFGDGGFSAVFMDMQARQYRAQQEHMHCGWITFAAMGL